MSTASIRSHDRILLKALELFSEKGYDATSVREICEAAGITKPTLYHFYGSKEGVYRALVEGALERFRSDMSRRARRRGHAPRASSRAWRAPTSTSALREPQLARFLMALIHNPPRSAPATDFVGFYEGVVAAHRARRRGRGRARRARARPDRDPDARASWALSARRYRLPLCGQPELSHELADSLVDTCCAAGRSRSAPGGAAMTAPRSSCSSLAAALRRGRAALARRGRGARARAQPRRAAQPRRPRLRCAAASPRRAPTRCPS